MFEDQEIELSESIAVRLQRYKADAKFLVIGKLSRLFIGKEARNAFGDLRTFCCFVGHGRSGGTLVGALLNAHPNIVMSNELNALRHLRNGLTARQLYRIIYILSQRQARRGSQGGGGYSYAVPGQWQGNHRDIRVIGDRKAGATAYEIVRDPTLLDKLASKITLQKKFMHVIRNPLDTITTTYRNTLPKRTENAHAHLSREIRNYFARCSAVRLIERRFGSQSICHLSHERLISDPTNQLREVCGFLGVDSPADYLKDCASILMKNPNPSRKSLHWPADQLAFVRRQMESIPWLEEYLVNT